LRIVLTGSHSTGKTSLANAVRDALVAKGVTDVALVREVGRDLIASGVPLNEDITSDARVCVIVIEQLVQVGNVVRQHDAFKFPNRER